jgi:hypothetical protein
MRGLSNCRDYPACAYIKLDHTGEKVCVHAWFVVELGVPVRLPWGHCDCCGSDSKDSNLNPVCQLPQGGACRGGQNLSGSFF